jgi:hypothetical protein
VKRREEPFDSFESQGERILRIEFHHFLTPFIPVEGILKSQIASTLRPFDRLRVNANGVRCLRKTTES